MLEMRLTFGLSSCEISEAPIGVDPVAPVGSIEEVGVAVSVAEVTSRWAPSSCFPRQHLETRGKSNHKKDTNSTSVQHQTCPHCRKLLEGDICLGAIFLDADKFPTEREEIV